jgi:hypothetical protein
MKYQSDTIIEKVSTLEILSIRGKFLPHNTFFQRRQNFTELVNTILA